MRFPTNWVARKAGQRITAEMVPGGGARLLRDFKQYGLPDSPASAAMRFAPDLLFSGLYASSLPEEYANGGEKALLFGEDLASQALPGMLASAGAGFLTRRFGGSRRLAGQLAGFADMAGSIGVPMALRMGGMLPMQRQLDARAQANAELQQQMAMQGAFDQGLQAAGGGILQSNALTGVDRSTQALIDMLNINKGTA